MSVTTDRIIDISENPVHLRLENRQLVVEGDSSPARTIPFEEIAVLIVSNSRVTYSNAVLQSLAMCGGALIVCDIKSLPVSMCVPIAGFSLPGERLRKQIIASGPTNKRIWRSLVKAKIEAQSVVLKRLHGCDGGVGELVCRLRSGDPENVESQAARKYWPLLFGCPSFRRRPRDGDPPNHLLNYGYAVLRAMTARALAASGLNLTLGVFHKNRADAYALADDVMEPFRPLIDQRVAEIVREQGMDAELGKETKKKLISVCLERLMHEGEFRTLFDVLLRIASSIARIYEGGSEEVALPKEIVALDQK